MIRPVIVLASGSSRRRELLERVGFAVKVDAAAVTEQREPGAPAEEVVVSLARAKALEVAARHGEHPVLGADTLVRVGDEVLGKPVDRADAARMLRLLSGRRHEVLTGVVLVPPGREPLERVSVTGVEMAALSDEEIGRYVAGREPYDKAGGYGIQATAGWFVAGITGSYSNVMGLPLEAVRELTAEAGLPFPSLRV